MTQPPGTTPPQPPDKEQIERAAEALAEIWQQLTGAFKRQQQKSDTGDPKTKEPSDRSVSLWALGLVPVFLACLHLMIVTRGNTETLRSLVQNLNVTALVLATILPLGTTALTWWLIFTLLLRITRPKAQRKPNSGLSLIFQTVIVLAVDFFAMPVRYAVINLAIFGALILCMVVFAIATAISAKRRTPAETMSKGMASAWALVFVCVPTVIWLGFLGVWLPQERLSFGTNRVEPAYVLSYDDRWIKYMDDARTVHIAPTPSVTNRETLGQSQSVWRQSLYGLWLQSRATEIGDQTPAPQPTPTQPAATTSSPAQRPTTQSPPANSSPRVPTPTPTTTTAATP
jgi:hypothetical protein